MNSDGKIADAVVPISWLAWIISHLQEINSLLQTILLLASIVATIAATAYHWRKYKQMGKGKRR